MPSSEHRSRRPSSAQLDAVDALHHHSVDALDMPDPAASFPAAEDRRNRCPTDGEPRRSTKLRRPRTAHPDAPRILATTNAMPRSTPPSTSPPLKPAGTAAPSTPRCWPKLAPP